MAPRAGIEPATNALTVRRSTTELPRNTGGSLTCPPMRGYTKLTLPETIFAAGSLGFGTVASFEADIDIGRKKEAGG